MSSSAAALRSSAETAVHGSETGFGPVVTLSQLAAQLGVTVQALYDLRSQGRGPRGFRVGRELVSMQTRCTSPAARGETCLDGPRRSTHRPTLC